MNTPPLDPPGALADLLDSLRMSGIRHLPRAVAGSDLPKGAFEGQENLSQGHFSPGSSKDDPRAASMLEPVRPIPKLITPAIPRLPVAEPMARAEAVQASTPSRTLFALESLPDSATDTQLESSPLTAPERLDRLAQLAEEVSRCSKCKELARTRARTVFGVGPIDPDLCVIGEAPGAQEDLKGEPFVGDAGQLLDKILKACGFERSQVYICNILRCRPPANRTPDPVEAQNCRPFLEATLSLVKPKFLCLMGATAARYLLETSSGIGALRGRELSWRGIPTAATYHPAYLLRYPDKKHDAWEDMKRMLARMGRAVPGA